LKGIDTLYSKQLVQLPVGRNESSPIKGIDTFLNYLVLGCGYCRNDINLIKSIDTTIHLNLNLGTSP